MHNTIEQIVRSSPLFNGLNNEDVNLIMARATAQTIAAGRTVAREGGEQTHLRFIKRGCIKVFKITPAGYEVLLVKLLQGNSFGLGTLLPDNEPYPANAETIGETSLYAWDKPTARNLAKKYPTLIENAILITLQRYLEYSDKYLSFVSAEHRLGQQLLQIGARIGKQTTQGLEIPATEKGLASDAHVDPITAECLLTNWEDTGVLEKRERTLVIRSPESMISSLLGAVHSRRRNTHGA